MTDQSWDERYRRGDNTESDPSPLLVHAASNRRPGRALDLACGAGRNALFLASHCWDVIAVDVSRVAVEILRQRARERGLQIDARVADLERGELTIETESFDLIADFYYLQRDLFPSIRGGLRPDGLFVAAIHLVDDSPEVKPMNPAYLLEPGELIREFSGWEILHAREVRHGAAQASSRTSDGKKKCRLEAGATREEILVETAHRRASEEIIARKPRP